MLQCWNVHCMWWALGLLYLYCRYLIFFIVNIELTLT